MDESCLYSDLHRTLWLNPAIPNHSCDRVHRSTVSFKESEHSVKDERSNFLLVSLLPSILHGSCACKAAMLSRAQGSYKQPKLWAPGLINYQFNALLFKSQDISFGCMLSLVRVLHMVSIGLYKIGKSRKNF